MFKFITGSGERRSLNGTNKIIRDSISTLTALYLIFAVLFYPEPILHKSIAFGLFYCVIFISYCTPGVKAIAKIPLYDWVLSGLSLSVSLYVGLNVTRYINRIRFYDPVLFMDIVFAGIAIFLLFEGTRRVIGPWLPGLSLIGLLYFAFGHFIPGRFGHFKLDINYITDGLFMGSMGLWGLTMGIATGKIMIFLLFGTLFKNTGAGDFLFDFLSKIAGKSKGGIGKIAIMASAMFGMVSGGPLTNATTTGAMTIPAMKRSGFSSEYAACVESCASVGGIFMPPVMGAVAFIMSDVVGIPYFEVIKRAILPAVIYFTALFFAVDFRARKKGIGGAEKITKEKFMKLLLRGYNFFIPIGYLVFRLVGGRTAAKAGLETIVLMLVLGLFNRRKPLTFKIVFNSLKEAVNRGTIIIATLAMCGILVGIIDLTGLPAKLTSYLAYVADFSIVMTLIVIMVVTLFLGLAMNISSTYLIVAVLGAPILVSAGFEPLSVHMFILFFAAMATITPPVAITSYAAATIAKAKPMKVGFMSMKVGLVAYILPFVFIYKPALLLYGTAWEMLFAFISAAVGTAILAMGLEGWLFGTSPGYLTRFLLGSAGILIVVGNWQLMAFAAVILLFILIKVIFEINKNKKIAEVKNEKS